MFNRELRRAIEQALRATGLPWSITIGRNHKIIKLDNRMIATTNFHRGEDAKNIIARIKNYARNRNDPPA